MDLVDGQAGLCMVGAWVVHGLMHGWMHAGGVLNIMFTC